MKRECETCIKRKTPYCPTSIECMATDDMPYYQNRIMLLEENEQLRQDYAQIVSNNCDYLLLQQENEQLKDNWNKLKEYMINVEQIYKESDDEYVKDMHEMGIRHAYKTILYKMQEIEGSDSNE